MSNKYQQFSKLSDDNPSPKKPKKSFKEVKFRPNIGENDFQVKLKQIKSFLEKGLQVRITLTIRGRENQFKTEGLAIFDKIKDGVDKIGAMDPSMKQAGANYMRTINPLSKPKK